MIPLFAATYGAVFLAEVAGDKLLYITGVLATRYRPVPVIAGALAAFMAKMAIAVVIGSSIANLPPLLVAAISAFSFFSVAYSLWRKQDGGAQSNHEPLSGNDPQGALTSFAAIFFSEWGDIGQITAATLAARSGMPVVVWFAAVGAMITKAILATCLGAGLLHQVRGRVPGATVRYCGVALAAGLGILSITLR